MAIKQSVCLPIMVGDEVTNENLIDWSAEIGFAAVEVWGREEEFDQICERATGLGLRVASFIGHNDIPNGLNDRSSHNRIEQELRASIDVAAERDVPGIICFSGNHIPDMSEEEAIANTVAGLNRVASYAESRGVTLNLELLNSKIDHIGYQCDRTSWGRAVVDEVGKPSVKLLYDIYHMQIMEGDVIRTLLDNLDAIGHIHTAGVPGREELDDRQELNYRGICRALSEAGYSGYMGHEFRPRGDTREALESAFERCSVG